MRYDNGVIIFSRWKQTQLQHSNMTVMITCGCQFSVIRLTVNCEIQCLMLIQARPRHSLFSYKTLRNLLLQRELSGEGLVLSHILPGSFSLGFIWSVENDTKFHLVIIIHHLSNIQVLIYPDITIIPSSKDNLEMGVHLHSRYVNINYIWQSTVFSGVQDACVIDLLFCAYFSFNHKHF